MHFKLIHIHYKTIELELDTLIIYQLKFHVPLFSYVYMRDV